MPSCDPCVMQHAGFRNHSMAGSLLLGAAFAFNEVPVHMSGGKPLEQVNPKTALAAVTEALVKAFLHHDRSFHDSVRGMLNSDK